MIEKEGFEIVGIKKTHLTEKQAESFYKVHKGKPFYEKLVKFMTSGAVVALALKKENAVSDFRSLIGSTNPENAEEGTIRKKYAKSVTVNAVHGSDSNENALLESSFFFSKLDLV